MNTKTISKRLICLLLAVTLLPQALASHAYAEATVEANSLDLPNLETAVSTLPTAEVGTDTQYDLVIKVRKGVEFIFPANATSDEGRLAFNQLSSQQKERFLKIRSDFLAKAAPVLASSELTYGVGSVVRGVFRRIMRKGDQHPNPLGGTLRERGRRAQYKMLSKLDNLLWRNAREVVTRNEFVLRASLGLTLQGGYVIKKNGELVDRVLGGTMTIGTHVGYNSEHKTLLYDVFFEREKLERAWFCPLLVGVAPKVAFGIFANDQKGQRFDGCVVYPPVIPTYKSGGENFGETGASITYASFPPLIAEVYTYKTRVTTYAPFIRKFLVDDKIGTVTSLTERLEEIAKRLEQRDKTESDCETKLSQRASGE